MTEIESMVATITESLAKTAEHCAQTLEASNSSVTGAQALRSFATAIRCANAKAEGRDAPHH
jgi:hypothetical protein